MFITIRSVFRNPGIQVLVLVIVAVAVAILGAGLVPDADLKKSLQGSAVTLVFSAVLGGVVKLLLDEFERNRQRRAEAAQFITNVLADLKAVYDKVDHVRILLTAHQSAFMFDKEMDDLIEAVVKLRNVTRALASRPQEKPPKWYGQLRAHVKAMEDYIEELVREFQKDYKDLSNLQNIYDAQVKAYLAAVEKGAAPSIDSFPQNEPWKELCGLRTVKDFIEADGSHSCTEQAQNGETKAPKTKYEAMFLCSLDLASKLLREQLKATLNS